MVSTIGNTVWLLGKSKPIEPFEDKFTYTGEYEYIDDGEKGWRIKFLTSGALQLLEDVVIDIFAVGGGGGSIGRGGGGGGGRAVTERRFVAESGRIYSITIGVGGMSNTNQNGRPTEITTADGLDVSWILYAGGGNLGTTTSGGDGGSGGGGVGIEAASAYLNGGNGGSNGSNGSSPSGYAGTIPGGDGYGKTTREFGESNGDLYAGGGGGSSLFGSRGYGGAGGGGDGYFFTSGSGGVIPAEDGEPNTGGGAGGGGANGGSGIVIIRNAR